MIIPVTVGLYCNRQGKNITPERTLYVKCCYIGFLLNMSTKRDAYYEIKKKPNSTKPASSLLVKLILDYSI